jgi:hypothetical protein
VSGDELVASGSVELEIPGVELRLVIERGSNVALPRDIDGQIDVSTLDIDPDREHPLFLTARQRDQSRIWTSPLFLSSAPSAYRA